MALLSERQKKAEVLSNELRMMGAQVVNPMPLADGQKLRFRILDALAPPVLEALREGEWDARFVSQGPQFHLSGQTPLTNLYEINIPMPMTPIWDNRIQPAELATPSSAKKSDVEMEGLKKYLGIK